MFHGNCFRRRRVCSLRPRDALAWICIVTLFREEAARISRFNKRPPFSPSSRRGGGGRWGYSCRRADCKTAGIIRPATSLTRDRLFHPRVIGELLPRLNDAYLFFTEAVPPWTWNEEETTTGYYGSFAFYGFRHGTPVLIACSIFHINAFT